MNRSAAICLLLALFLFSSCDRARIGPERWKRLERAEKILVVESLRGHEAANDAKGGGGRLHPLTSEIYVARIDELYARGDTRSVQEIWDSLVEMRPASKAR